MADVPADTQAQRMPHGKPNSEGLADAPLDTAAGTVKPLDGPMDRAGTEAGEAARGGTSLGAERDKSGGR